MPWPLWASRPSQKFSPPFSEQVRGWLLPVLVGICLTACFLEFMRGFTPYFNAFTRDQRLELLTWMDGDLPPGTKVVADPAVLLPNLLAEKKRKFRFELLADDGAIDPAVNRFDQFVAAGIGYAVLSDI